MDNTRRNDKCSITSLNEVFKVCRIIVRILLVLCVFQSLPKSQNPIKSFLKFLEKFDANRRQGSVVGSGGVQTISVLNNNSLITIILLQYFKMITKLQFPQFLCQPV